MGRNKSHGYFMDYPLANSDGKTFRKLNHQYAIDLHQVHYGKEIIKGADARSFKIVDDHIGLSRDKRSYYKHSTKLPVKDYKTFVRLSGDFWKDKYLVYYIYNPINPDRVILKGIDAKSEESINDVTVKDKYGCHNGYKRVKCR